jgi:Tfp pilus assembly protein PilO
LPRSRHQTVTRAFQIAGASLVLLDVLLYFGAYHSAQALLFSEQQQFASLRRRIFEGETRIERLTQFREALPETSKKLASLEQEHTPPRRQAGSRAAKLVRLVTQQSGAQLANVAFKFDTKASGPLQRLGMVVNVQGPFPALLKFAHGLETASDLLVIRSFNIAESDEGVLQLRLKADLYLTP